METMVVNTGERLNRYTAIRRLHTHITGVMAELDTAADAYDVLVIKKYI